MLMEPLRVLKQATRLLIMGSNVPTPTCYMYTVDIDRYTKPTCTIYFQIFGIYTICLIIN